MNICHFLKYRPINCRLVESHEWPELKNESHWSELLRLPANILRHGHHLVDDGVHLILIQKTILVCVVHPEHDLK